MREIKFRAWANGKMHYMKEGDKDWFILSRDKFIALQSDSVFDIGGVGCECNTLDDYDFVLEQFTGLRDKNGAEIYEGDKIRFFEESKMPDAEVKFRDGVFIAYDELWKSWNFLFSVNNRVIVVGNIHENAELLEK